MTNTPLPEFRYISFGAGVQSTALLICSVLGLQGIPKADCAIFADTRGEPAWVYHHLKKMIVWARGRNFPIYRVSAGNLLADLLNKRKGGGRFSGIPAFTSSVVNGKKQIGMLRRQCTREYKITPIQQKVRRLLGYRKGARVRHSVFAYLGISTDEASRMKPSRERWITNVFPLVDAGISRQECLRIIRKEGIELPGKSACVFCPFHNSEYWHRLKTKHPKEWKRAVAVDIAIRDNNKCGVTSPIFLHRRLTSLDSVPFVQDRQRAFFDPFINECEGICGV